jgi:hypothetical protein
VTSVGLAVSGRLGGKSGRTRRPFRAVVNKFAERDACVQSQLMAGIDMDRRERILAGRAVKVGENVPKMFATRLRECQEITCLA